MERAVYPLRGGLGLPREARAARAAGGVRGDRELILRLNGEPREPVGEAGAKCTLSRRHCAHRVREREVAAARRHLHNIRL